MKPNYLKFFRLAYRGLVSQHPGLKAPSTGEYRHARLFTSSTDHWCQAKPEAHVPHPDAATVHVVIIDKEGKRHNVEGKVGQDVMRLGQQYGLPIEGACEASLACCTCHVYVQDEFVDKLPEPERQEEDMLDMAPFLKPNSRLGCQVVLTEEMEGMVIELPKATRNFYVDGHVPAPH